MNKKLSRRQFITSAAAIGLGTFAYLTPGWLSVFLVGGNKKENFEWIRSYLTKIFSDKQHVLGIGATYLRLKPNEKDINFLIKKICTGKEEFFKSKLVKGSTEVFDDHIRKQHLDDLQNSHVVYVDGWVLSQTEARIYGLVKLLWSDSLQLSKDYLFRL